MQIITAWLISMVFEEKRCYIGDNFKVVWRKSWQSDFIAISNGKRGVQEIHTIIFGGDFNAVRKSGVYMYIGFTAVARSF